MNKYEHDWRCVEVGFHDSSYECKKCGKWGTESIDNPSSALSKTGCTVPDRRPQHIVCAAIKIDSIILCGARHWDIVMRSQAEAIGLDKIRALKKEVREVQGFIDQYGRFLTREEAMKIVRKNGQPFDIDRNRAEDKLYSEGLY